MKIQFRIRTILIVVGVVAFFCAAWNWTNTYGVWQLKTKYNDQAREVVSEELERSGVEMRVDEVLLELDLVSPRTIFPFILVVETEYSQDFRQTIPRKSWTHVWFFGYLSEAL